VKAVGLDLGERRIGVAVSDRAGALAMPVGMFERSGDQGRDHADLACRVAELGAEVVVVGLPLSLDGTRGPAALAAEEEAALLRALLPVPVELQDERLSTVTASRALRRAGRAARRQRPVVDQAAAAVMLQAWLDRRRGDGCRHGVAWSPDARGA
jgi:putative Holliday junction resolvase